MSTASSTSTGLYLAIAALGAVFVVAVGSCCCKPHSADKTVHAKTENAYKPDVEELGDAYTAGHSEYIIDSPAIVQSIHDHRQAVEDHIQGWDTGGRGQALPPAPAPALPARSRHSIAVPAAADEAP